MSRRDWHHDENPAHLPFPLTSSLFRRASRSLRIPRRHSRKMRTPKGGAHFFVAAEEEFRMRTTPLNALIQGDLLRIDDENGQHVRRGSAACEEQDAFALMPHKVSSLSPRGKLFRIDLALRYFAGTPILANIPPPLHESEGYYNKKGADNTSARVVCSARELNRRCWGA